MTLPDESGRLTRKQYQKRLQRHKRRVRKRRRARIRRVRIARTLRTTQFWTRVSIVAAVLLLFAFWSRFALVYDIPSYARRGSLTGIAAYVTVKPWWFGPPSFDLRKRADYPLNPLVGRNKYAVLLQNLGKYRTVIENPQFIWVKRNP